ncbi:protein SPO16 homolog [Saccoglossus kowalevskii]
MASYFKLLIQEGEIARLLQNHKVRVSENTIQDTCIFPLSSVAFMIVKLNEATTIWPPNTPWKLQPDLVERIERFNTVHRHGHLVLMATLFGPHELSVFTAVQERFMNTKLSILPAHNTNEAVDNMLTVAKATCKPASEIISQRVNHMTTNHLSADYIMQILSKIGINGHHILLTVSVQTK